jgi:hypothetical protein
MATNAVYLIASPTLLLFDLKTGGLKLFLAAIGKSLLDTKTQIGDGRFEPSNLHNLIEQAIFELTEHGLDIVGRLSRAFLGVRSPWRVLASRSKCRGHSPRRWSALAHNRSDAVNRQRSPGRFRNISSAVRRTSFIIVRRYDAVVRSRIWKRFERARESERQFRARDCVRKSSGRIKQIDFFFLISVLRGRRRRRQRRWTRAERRRAVLMRRRPGIGATRRRVGTMRRQAR